MAFAAGACGELLAHLPMVAGDLCSLVRIIPPAWPSFRRERMRSANGVFVVISFRYYGPEREVLDLVCLKELPCVPPVGSHVMLASILGGNAPLVVKSVQICERMDDEPAHAKIFVESESSNQLQPGDIDFGDWSKDYGSARDRLREIERETCGNRSELRGGPLDGAVMLWKGANFTGEFFFVSQSAAQHAAGRSSKVNVHHYANYDKDSDHPDATGHYVAKSKGRTISLRELLEFIQQGEEA
jgi:hypothetical protein